MDATRQRQILCRKDKANKETERVGKSRSCRAATQRERDTQRQADSVRTVEKGETSP